MFNPLSTKTLSCLLSSGIASIDYERLLESHYKKWLQAGDVVVDIGAHAGRHLEQFLQSVGPTGRVFGFEPLPDKFALLAQNFDGHNVCLHNLALSSTAGTFEFVYAEGSPQESGLRERVYNNPETARPRKISVDVQTLDSFVDRLSGLAFIKIDIEGAEIDCLNGSAAVLTAYRPVISVEYGQQGYSVYGNTKWTLYEFCERHGYMLYDIFLNRLSTRAAWAAAVDSVYWDYLMVPREKEQLFLSRLRPNGDTTASPRALIASAHLDKDAGPMMTLLQGFSSPEEWGYWTEGWNSSMRIALPEPPRGDLVLAIVAHGFVNQAHRRTDAMVLVNGHDAGHITFDIETLAADSTRFEFAIPRTVVPDPAVLVEIKILDPKSPADLGLSADTRKLGIGLHSVELYEELP